MKVFKKLAGLALAVCLAVPVFGTVAFAADGVLMYSDPSTKVGEEFSIDLVVRSNSGETVGDVQVTNDIHRNINGLIVGLTRKRQAANTTIFVTGL